MELEFSKCQRKAMDVESSGTPKGPTPRRPNLWGRGCGLSVAIDKRHAHADTLEATACSACWDWHGISVGGAPPVEPIGGASRDQRGLLAGEDCMFIAIALRQSFLITAASVVDRVWSPFPPNGGWIRGRFRPGDIGASKTDVKSGKGSYLTGVTADKLACGDRFWLKTLSTSAASQAATRKGKEYLGAVCLWSVMLPAEGKHPGRDL